MNTNVRFLPSMKLHEAAKQAHEQGFYLILQWDGNKPHVTAVPIPEDIPSFLRLQAS